MSSAAVATFEALGDETRLTLVLRLSSWGPTPTLELVDGLGMSRQAATKHLKVLEDAGLVKSRAEGRTVMRELETEALADAAVWLEARAAAWDRKLNALKAYLEGPAPKPAEPLGD